MTNNGAALKEPAEAIKDAAKAVIKEGKAKKSKKAKPSSLTAQDAKELQGLVDAIEKAYDDVAFSEHAMESKRIELCRRLGVSPRTHAAVKDGDKWVMQSMPQRRQG